MQFITIALLCIMLDQMPIPFPEIPFLTIFLQLKLLLKIRMVKRFNVQALMRVEIFHLIYQKQMEPTQFMSNPVLLEV